MDIYVARQPVCNGKQKVIGYELLYRSGLTNSYGGPDGTNASLAVVRNVFLFLRQRKVPQASQVFINLTGVQSAHIVSADDRFREMEMAMLSAKRY